MAAARKRPPSRRRAPSRRAAVPAARQAFARDWARRSKTLERLALRPVQNLSVDDVHDLRVTTRRLRALLSVMRHCVTPEARARRARRELRALGRALGERRMLDIALRDAAHYRAGTAGIEKSLAGANAALRRTLRTDRVRQLLADLRRVEAGIDDAPFQRLSTWLQEFERELVRLLDVPPRTPAERHELRIEMKKIRYVIEAFGRRSPSMRLLQDHLGREHDLVVLQSMCGRIPGAARDERMARARAKRLMPTALRAAMRHLRAIRGQLAR